MPEIGSTTRLAPVEEPVEEPAEDPVDEWGVESFPASDPPTGWQGPEEYGEHHADPGDAAGRG